MQTYEQRKKELDKESADLENFAKKAYTVATIAISIVLVTTVALLL